MTNIQKIRIRSIRSDLKVSPSQKTKRFARVKVNFFLRKPGGGSGRRDGILKDIYSRIVYDRSQVEFHTGISIPPLAWENKRIKSLTDEYIEFQKLLETIEFDVLKIENELRAKGCPIKPEIIRDKLIAREKSYKTFFEVLELFNATRKQLIGKEISEITYNRNVRWAEEIKAFAKTYFTGTPQCYEIGTAFAQDLFHHLKVNKNLSHDAACRRPEYIKRVLDYAIIHGHLNGANVLRNIRFKRENKPKLHFLSIDQVNKIKNTTFENEQTSIIRDGFLFQVYTGVSFIDLKNLTTENIYIDPKQKKWLKVERSKTKNFAMIPLLPEALEMIEKYKGYKHSQRAQLNNWNGLIPCFDNGTMNKVLKIIGPSCGIPEYLMCTHTARKSFGTIALNSGKVSIESVAKMLGHVNTKTTSKFYAQVSTEKIGREMENFSFSN